MNFLIRQALQHLPRTALSDPNGNYSYQTLLNTSQDYAQYLLALGLRNTAEKGIAFWLEPDFQYVAVQWAIWQTRSFAVPIAVSHPAAEVEYILTDSQVEVLVCSANFENVAKPLCEKLGIKCLLINQLQNQISRKTSLPICQTSDPALMIYTSGTTSRPKGVLTTHAQLESQVRTLVQAWEWQTEDRTLNVLPLHHVHGIVNILGCALFAGASCEMLPKFEAKTVWDRILEEKITLFMAVPTVYTRLIEFWEQQSPDKQAFMSEKCQKLRLMVSGSAALPETVLKRWQKISGHILLERYGMTETGMILSNPLHGNRKAGFVGKPLPNVQVRLVEENGREITEIGKAGEIQVKSPSVFREYWQKPEETAKSFVENWFFTGDVAERDSDGDYRILGRKSSDIIKTGGYKVSALEIESVVLQYSAIAECAVVGLADETWGEKIALVFIPKHEISTEELRNWLKTQLAHYKVPTIYVSVAELPRNAMGKVMKAKVKEMM